jgi:protein TonB
MKQHDQRNPSRKKFLRIPTFPGGKEAYLRFISENIVYPESAILNKVEGYVHISYAVNNIGEIEDITVSKGIGYGCDEEAIRVIKLMKYEPVKNRGVRMKVEMKTRIHFQLPNIIEKSSQQSFQINYSSANDEKQNSPEPKPKAVYNYSINLG